MENHKDYGFTLLADIVRAARNGKDYAEDLKELLRIAELDIDVKNALMNLINNLEKQLK